MSGKITSEKQLNNSEAWVVSKKPDPGPQTSLRFANLTGPRTSLRFANWSADQFAVNHVIIGLNWSADQLSWPNPRSPTRVGLLGYC